MSALIKWIKADWIEWIGKLDRMKIAIELNDYRMTIGIELNERGLNWMNMKIKLNELRTELNKFSNIEHCYIWLAILCRLLRTCLFHHVIVLLRTAKARAQLLLCSLNLLIGDLLVAVVVVICLSSLLMFCLLLSCRFKPRRHWIIPRKQKCRRVSHSQF